MEKRKVCIGIPCYQNAPSETLEDYMRFAYHLGRRMPEFDFFLAVKPKFEQFRARNSIFQAAAQMKCDFLMMLDDDQVIGWSNSNGPSEQYDFLRKLIGHMDREPRLGIVGALYYHRGGDCMPVLMKEGNDGGYYYMRDDEIKGEFQEVAVTGGGAMLCRMDTLLKVPQPIFEPEFKYGTDIQVCQKVREAGFKVACDTGVVLGHVKTAREVVTPENRVRIMMESPSGGSDKAPQFDPKWTNGTAYNLYHMDGMEHLGIKTQDELMAMAQIYNDRMADEFPGPDGNLEEYYRSRGRYQLARQIYFHGTKYALSNDQMILCMFRPGGDKLHGLEYACGSSPVGFEFVLRGNTVDFVDIEGAGGYEFVKWRAKRRGVEDRCGWKLGGPYDFILLLDALEHFPDPNALMRKLAPLLKDNGVVVTNYFYLGDHDNLEHISMDKETVKDTFISCGIYPLNPAVWIKRDLGFMDKKEDVKNEHSEKDGVLR